MIISEPADVALAGIPAPVADLVLIVVALSLFSYIMFRRIRLLRQGMPDSRSREFGARSVAQMELPWRYSRQLFYL